MGLSFSLSLSLYQLMSPIYSGLGYFLHHSHCHLLSCSGQKKTKYGGFSWSNCKTLPIHHQYFIKSAYRGIFDKKHMDDFQTKWCQEYWDHFPGLIKAPWSELDRKRLSYFPFWVKEISIVDWNVSPWFLHFNYHLIATVLKQKFVFCDLSWSCWQESMQ